MFKERFAYRSTKVITPYNVCSVHWGRAKDGFCIEVPWGGAGGGGGVCSILEGVLYTDGYYTGGY